MKTLNLSLLAFLFFLFSPLQSTLAIKKSYIVYLGLPSHDSILPSSLLDLKQLTESHYDLLETLLGSAAMAKQSILYSYTRILNGFAAVLDDKQAEALAKYPNVIAVLENKARELHTTHSWKFLGLENHGGIIPSNSLWNAAKFGEDVIIANLDTGVWPESKSFSDEGYGPIPSKWKGSCEGGYNFTCNRKLIGARFFSKGYLARYGGTLKATELSARDNEGHGTHTLSTAGGNFVAGANVFGYGNGTAKGGSPRARVVAYKVCWKQLTTGQCFEADILAAFEAAIGDGVDVISASLGGFGRPYYTDSLAIGAFHAVQRGIAVVFSAGNSGPFQATVANSAPWKLTVAASTMDRDFPSYVVLGNGKRLKGTSLSAEALSENTQYPLIKGQDAATHGNLTAQFCEENTLDAKKLKGKIVVCVQGGSLGSVEKGAVVRAAGAVGMIVVNSEDHLDELFTYPHLIPATNLRFDNAQILYHYINSTKSPVAYITKPSTEIGTKPAPVMATFSSRGPSPIDNSILKPDITAPGVNVLASYSETSALSTSKQDKRRIAFDVMSGTSMACPHVAGVVGLLKSLYPQWSPAALRSAIITSAKTTDNNGHTILNKDMDVETPFAYGAGHINPNGAMDPGLVYDISANDYLNYLCAQGYNETQMRLFSSKPFKCMDSLSTVDLNYPSITIDNITTPTTINRKIKNVGSLDTYVALIEAPVGVSVSVEPSSLQFTRVGEEKSFKVVMKSTGTRNQKNYAFGSLIWSDGKHYVRSPISVKW